MNALARLRRRRARARSRGFTLIEVLVAFFILFVVTLAVLQMLSMAYLVNLGSLIRTDLTYRAQRVVETIRLQRYRVFSLGMAPDDTCCPVDAGASKTISPGDCTDFWGPNGANVMEANARYTLSYSINNTNGVTVLATPLTGGANVYLGLSANKVVVYVAQFQ
jgi:Tfp pilus assembly protein FimT